MENRGFEVFRRLNQSRKLASHGYDRGFCAVASQEHLKQLLRGPLGFRALGGSGV